MTSTTERSENERSASGEFLDENASTVILLYSKASSQMAIKHEHRGNYACSSVDIL